MKKTYKIALNANISHNNEDDTVGVCSSYSEGKCLDKPEKYCDGCASEYGNEY
ncbi:MAG: hypothetical protein K0R54_758 [Clostridiaceae bacterium]|jgi:hypothetical protein|nr:hypothetical protein [Clostridiaceae bacterium]